MTYCSDPDCPDRVYGAHEHLPEPAPTQGRGWLAIAAVCCLAAALYAAFAVSNVLVGDTQQATWSGIAAAGLLAAAALSLSNRRN